MEDMEGCWTQLETSADGSPAHTERYVSKFMCTYVTESVQLEKRKTSKAGHWAMVIGGQANGKLLSSVELISLHPHDPLKDRLVLDCIRHRANFPIASSALVGSTKSDGIWLFLRQYRTHNSPLFPRSPIRVWGRVSYKRCALLHIQL